MNDLTNAIPSSWDDELYDCKRLHGINETLRKLPPEQFAEWMMICSRVLLFIPHKKNWGFTGKSLQIGRPGYNTLYLSPRLEDLDEKYATAVAAHELAHLILGHNNFGLSGSDDIKLMESWIVSVRGLIPTNGRTVEAIKEDEVDYRLRSWGLIEEADVLKNMSEDL